MSFKHSDAAIVQMLKDTLNPNHMLSIMIIEALNAKEAPTFILNHLMSQLKDNEQMAERIIGKDLWEVMKERRTAQSQGGTKVYHLKVGDTFNAIQLFGMRISYSNGKRMAHLTVNEISFPEGTLFHVKEVSPPFIYIVKVATKEEGIDLDNPRTYIITRATYANNLIVLEPKA